MIIAMVVAVHVLARSAFLFGKSLKAGSPAALIPMIFDLFFIVPFVFVGSMELYTSIYALSILIIYSWLLQMGLYVGVEGKYRLNVYKFSYPKFIYAVLALNLTYLVGVMGNFDIALVSLNAASLGEIANSNSVARYSGVLDVSITYKLGVIAAFAAAVCGGVLFSVASNKAEKSISTLVLVIALIDSIVMGARAGFMMLILTFIVSSYTFYIKLGARQSTLSYLKLAKRGLMAIALVMLFFFFIQVLRGGGDFSNSSNIFNHVLTWFFGYLPAFSVWIDDYVGRGLSFGQYTFAGLVNLLGIAERVGGVYAMTSIGDSRYTNVFTAYRGLITDFGMVGSMLFFLIISIILGKGLKKGLSSFWIAYGSSMLLLTFLGWSFVVSIWTYNSVVLGQIIGLVVCSRSIKITRW